MNEHDTWAWNTLVSNDLMTTGITPGQPITASISWDSASATFTFNANGNTANYTVTGTINPPIDHGKQLRTRFKLVTDTTPTFTLDPITGANQYAVRIYSVHSGKTIWKGYPGNQSIGKNRGRDALYAFPGSLQYTFGKVKRSGGHCCRDPPVRAKTSRPVSNHGYVCQYPGCKNFSPRGKALLQNYVRSFKDSFASFPVVVSA